MKKLILLALAFIMCGCEKAKITNAYQVGTVKYYVVEINNCEYLRAGNHFTHKGNCKYCTERRRKEQEELIREIKEQ